MKVATIGISIALAMPLPAGAQTVNRAASAQTLSCGYPVNASDTAKTLLARYRGAKIDDVYIADSQVRGVRLFPDAGGGEVDVTFSDDRMTQVQYVMTVDHSTWSGPNGLRLGRPMSDVVAANGGRPLTISGFDWDYGGWIGETNGGPLHALAGKGCSFGVRLETTAQLPGSDGDKIDGEGVTLSSTDARVLKARPVISEMSITFGAPKP